jgi:hypothetical protein
MHSNIFVFSLILFSAVNAGIQTFKHTEVKKKRASHIYLDQLKPDPGYYYYKQGMFSVADAPSKSSPGNGKSFISVNGSYPFLIFLSKKISEKLSSQRIFSSRRICRNNNHFHFQF